MSMRRLAWAACAVALIASPAAAQGAAELLGVYHLSMTSKSGPDCPNDSEDNLNIDIRRISGARLMFGEEGKTEEEVAEYDPAARTFRFEQASSAGGSERSGVFSGRFTRMEDAVRLDMTVQIEGCTGKLTGFRPAPAIEIAPAAPATPAATGTAPLGMTPATPGAPQAAAAPASTWMSNPLVLGGGGLALLLAGAGIGLLLGRRKTGAEKPEPSDGPDA